MVKIGFHSTAATVIALVGCMIAARFVVPRWYDGGTEPIARDPVRVELPILSCQIDGVESASFLADGFAPRVTPGRETSLRLRLAKPAWVSGTASGVSGIVHEHVVPPSPRPDFPTYQGVPYGRHPIGDVRVTLREDRQSYWIEGTFWIDPAQRWQPEIPARGDLYFAIHDPSRSMGVVILGIESIPPTPVEP